jgi:hypothetical protein
MNSDSAHLIFRIEAMHTASASTFCCGFVLSVAMGILSTRLL